MEATQYVAEDLLKIEGFSDVPYVEVPLDLNHRVVGTDKVDISIGFIANYIVELDLDTPIMLLGGVHAGCFELFGTNRVNTIRDLRGKTVSVQPRRRRARITAQGGVEPPRAAPKSEPKTNGDSRRRRHCCFSVGPSPPTDRTTLH